MPSRATLTGTAGFDSTNTVITKSDTLPRHTAHTVKHRPDAYSNRISFASVHSPIWRGSFSCRFPSKQKSTDGGRCPFPYRFPYFFTAVVAGLAGALGAGAPTEA
ncbi:hypothetical protein [Neisseria meningitidis]|uniref:hypothetical protein n=2 Tax=Neisseria meningitidis TaxID=487 RepID=UPI00077BDCE8|nr:hypothetical protein [Neisseria meningitidis]MCV6772904.1 hypothetical protein [Neisseria meningitidis]MCV6775149.1 hypothetical protein [Neisseria meningitidis]MCV6786043.1 hypothetical protein [Neisseria meningitidis]